MLGSADIIAGKVAVQLRFAPVEAVRAALRAMAAEPQASADLPGRLLAAGEVTDPQAERLTELVAIFERSRMDGAYLRLLLRDAAHLRAEDVGAVLADQQRRKGAPPLDEALVGAGLLTAEQGRSLAGKHRRALAREDQQVIERYVAEDFAGVSRPLTNGNLEPEDLSLFKLFAKGLDAVKHAQKLLAATPPASPPVPAAPPVRRAALTMEQVKALTRIGEYEVVQLLGAGGMGAVFLGQKEGMGVFCAVKVMLDVAASEEERRRFKREIALGRRVNHEAVMSVLDAGETAEGLSYLVVPALVGKELQHLMDRAGAAGLPGAVATRTFENVLQGMQAIHDAGVVHRDVKPDNVMVLAGERGDVKIMDFGLARLEDESAQEDEAASFRTMGDEVSGSPPYVAPEVIRRRPVDRRADIYSLGVLFFQMLTGKLPFESDTPTGYLTQHVAMPPPTLAEVRPDVSWPPAAERLIDRMLAKAPEERPASCSEVVAELRGGLSAALVACRAADPKEAPSPRPDEGAWASKGILGRLTT